MDQFVLTRNIQRSIGLSENCMSERESQGELAMWKPREKPLDGTTMEFQSASTHACPSTGQKAECTNKQTSKCVRKCPYEAEQHEYSFHS